MTTEKKTTVSKSFLMYQDMERVFDRFYTVDKSHGGGGGGFGLGLAIVKKLCRRAGWLLSVESKLGEGTAFSVRFCPKAERREETGK